MATEIGSPHATGTTDGRSGRTSGGAARILIVGPAGGHTGGVAMWNDILLRSNLRERYRLIHLDTTRGRAGRGKAQTFAPVNVASFLQQTIRLIALLVFRRPKILHQPVTAHLSFRKETAFLALARLFGTCTIGHLHGGAFPDYYRKSSTGARRRIARALRRVDLLIALSEGGRHFLLTDVDSALAVAVVPTTIDPVFAEEALGIERRGRAGCRVLMIGRLGKAKGLLDALRAIPLVHARGPEIEFLFAGEVDADVEIEQARRAAEADRRIRFLGSVAGGEKVACFREADIMILPSHGENLPISVLEGMAAGLPLVVTPVGALPEFLADGRHALFAPAGDPAALANRIARLAADPGLRAEMGEANRALFNMRFRPREVMERIDDVYRAILEGRLRRRGRGRDIARR